jgi:hypothetical protein
LLKRSHPSDHARDAASNPRSLAPAAYASRVTAATRHPRNWYLIGTAALLQAPGTTGITGRRRLAAAKCPADNGVA